MALKIKTKTPKKLKWEPFKITRIKLNPEQAVLSCCQQGGRGLQVSSLQRLVGIPTCETPGAYMSS